MLLFHGTEHPRRNRSSLYIFTCASPDLQEDASPADRFNEGFACWQVQSCLPKLKERAEDAGNEFLPVGGCRCLSSRSFWVSWKPCKMWYLESLSPIPGAELCAALTSPRWVLHALSQQHHMSPSSHHSHGDLPSVVCETKTLDMASEPVTQSCYVLPPSSCPKGKEAHVQMSLLDLAASRNASPGRWSLLATAALWSALCPSSGDTSLTVQWEDLLEE